MTTIAVDDTTQQILASLKHEWGAASYDEVIRRLVQHVKPLPDSLFGASAGLPRRKRTGLDEDDTYRRWDKLRRKRP